MSNTEAATATAPEESLSITPLCFILMPFGKKKDAEGVEIDFDKIYYEGIKPAIEDAGLEPLRADAERTGEQRELTQVDAGRSYREDETNRQNHVVRDRRDRPRHSAGKLDTGKHILIEHEPDETRCQYRDPQRDHEGKHVSSRDIERTDRPHSAEDRARRSG